MADEAPQDAVEGAASADRYPTLRKALWLVQQAAEDIDLPVERVELNTFASGDVTCRWWEPRAEEPDGVHVPPQE